ncbi:MAG: hypothetical protein ACRYF3_11600 [Janthinobacterium lividum]
MRPTHPATRRTARSDPGSLREAWIALAGLSAVFLFEMLDNSILESHCPPSDATCTPRRAHCSG